MKDGTQPRNEIRLSVLALAVILWSLVILSQLTKIQILQHEYYVQKAREQQQTKIHANAKRGAIWDRRYQELAVSAEVPSVYASPRTIPDEEIPDVAAKLAEALDLAKEALTRRLTDKSTKGFVWVKRKVSEEEARRVAALHLPGVGFIKEDQRFYPGGQLASHVLGFVNIDNNGLAGLEKYYDASLNGTPGQMAIRRDAKQRSFHTEVIKPALSGHTLVLNISRPVQYVVEYELAEVMRRSQAIAGSIVVMDPYSGQILAMANAPTFDPNRFSAYQADELRNRAVCDAFEPGSTFKVLVAGAALEENLTSPHEVINCQMGTISVRGHTFHDHKRFGLLSVSEVIAKSSDVGMIKLGLRLGEERLHKYITMFGIGRKTDVDLPGESAGLLQPPQRWSGISIGAISFGQEVGVTPLQLLRSICAIANGGYLVKPYVVDRILSASGKTVYKGHPERIPILGPQVAETVAEMMRGVVEQGTAKAAGMASYSAAGKTGTAQKIIARTYSRTKYVASFVGYAPVENPAMAAIVVLDEPKGKYHGGDVAAPVFKQMADRILVALGVQQTKEPKMVPMVIKKAAGRALQANAQPPEAGPGENGSHGDDRLDDPKLGSIIMPDFRTKSLREISYQCAQLGLTLKVYNRGLARAQQPPSGTRVAAGAVCQVWFGPDRAEAVWAPP